MAYIVRLNDKKYFWSGFVNNFIPEYQKFPLTIFESMEEARDFAIENSKNRKRPLLVCEVGSHKINWKISKEVEEKVTGMKKRV